MKTILLLSIFTGSFAFAQTESTTKPALDTAHIEMHEKMSKAHQQAADCLKSGKPVEECRTAFQSTCKDVGEPGHCGMGKGYRKGWKK